MAVESFSDVPDRFAPGRGVRLVPRSGPARRLTVASVRPHRGALLVRFDGIGDRDEVEPLRGARIEVGRDEVPAPPEGTYYFFQLIGCRVQDVREGDLGEVVDVVEDGGGVLLVVGRGEQKVPIPFVREMVRRVVPGTGATGESGSDRGLIELELPEGLLEACVSRS
jgi:16S rRNA processing protein RimM